MPKITIKRTEMAKPSIELSENATMQERIEREAAKDCASKYEILGGEGHHMHVIYLVSREKAKNHEGTEEGYAISETLFYFNENADIEKRIGSRTYLSRRNLDYFPTQEEAERHAYQLALDEAKRLARTYTNKIIEDHIGSEGLELIIQEGSKSEKKDSQIEEMAKKGA